MQEVARRSLAKLEAELAAAAAAAGSAGSSHGEAVRAEREGARVELEALRAHQRELERTLEGATRDLGASRESAAQLQVRRYRVPLRVRD